MSRRAKDSDRAKSIDLGNISEEEEEEEDREGGEEEEDVLNEIEDGRRRKLDIFSTSSREKDRIILRYALVIALML